MSKVFETTTIKGMELSNRFVRSATWEGLALEDGSCTPALITMMTRLAEGQVGLIIPGHTYISPEGQAGPWQLGVYQEACINGLKEMTDMVHGRGGKMVLQLAHAGYFANPKLTGRKPLTPSEVAGGAETPRQVMTVEDIQGVVEAFGQSARRAKEAGFDGLQIHAAHGYLLSQFLSPYFNKRTDVYGGSLENRARILREVLRRVREAVGEDFPVLIKMNSQDYLEGGFTLEESLKVGWMLQEEGIDAIEISGGTLISEMLTPSRTRITTEEREAYFRQAAKAFKARLQVPVILVGGIRSLPLAERLLEEGYADYLSLSRPLIREPGLIKRWASGDRAKAACLSDNQCFKPARDGEGLYCVVEKQEKEKESA